jgi:hypothetical protein
LLPVGTAPLYIERGASRRNPGSTDSRKSFSERSQLPRFSDAEKSCKPRRACSCPRPSTAIRRVWPQRETRIVDAYERTLDIAATDMRVAARAHGHAAWRGACVERGSFSRIA